MSSQKTSTMEKTSINTPDETRKFDKGKVEISNVGGASIGRFKLDPGWKWSTSVKPLVKTDSCQQVHTVYVISGIMRVKMDDGAEQEFGPGDTGFIPAGHDAWVVGNESMTGVDFTGAKTYTQK